VGAFAISLDAEVVCVDHIRMYMLCKSEEESPADMREQMHHEQSAGQRDVVSGEVTTSQALPVDGAARVYVRSRMCWYCPLSFQSRATSPLGDG
jgi:hypothetical protein